MTFAHVSLTQLRCFKAVVDHGGFVAASVHLHQSQSAVSHAVRTLEISLGVPLLLRSNRAGIALTAAGSAVLAEAQTALAAVERLKAAAREAAGSQRLNGKLRIGVVQSAAVHLLPGWLRLLNAEHPGIALTLHEGTDPEVTGWVLADVVQVGVTSHTHANLVATPVCQDSYRVVMPDGHPLAKQASLEVRDLDGQRMLLSGGGCETLIQELLTAAGSNPDIVCLVRDNATLASMVRAGLGLTIMPELALPADRAGLRVVGLQPDLRRTLHLLSKPADALGPISLAFLTMLERRTHWELPLSTRPRHKADREVQR